MPTRRFQQISRISVEEVFKEASSRNHVLVYYTVGKKDSSIIAKGSRVSLKCNTCGSEWDTRLCVYLKCKTTPSAGCRGCYNKNVVNPTIYPQSPCIQKPTVQDRPKRREGLKQLREAHLKGQFGFIQNREQLVQYLKENPNRHNIYVLDLLQRDLQIADEKPVQERQTVNHHVLPIFDQGSPDSWNIIQVTPQEHMQIHTLRFEVYGKEGDKKAIYATTFDFYRLSMDSENENNERPLKKEKNVVNWGVVRRTPEVTLALETGMVCTHKEGFSCKIEPESIETVREIINRLIKTFPESHPDRVRL